MAIVSREEIIEDIQRFLNELSKPFSEEDLRGGWTEGTRQRRMEFFKKMESDLKDKHINLSKKTEYITLIRGLDFWGITSGRLFENALDMSSKIEELAKKENRWFFWKRWFA